MNSNYLNQSYYQSIPSSEVNWAELAQRWIMSKVPDTPKVDIVGGPSSAFPFQPPPPPIGVAPLPMPYPPHLISLNAAAPPFFGMPPGPPSFMPPPGCFPPANAFQQNTDNEEYKAHYDASLEQDEDQPPDALSEDATSDTPAGAMSHWFSGFSAEGAPQPADAIKEWSINSAWPIIPVVPSHSNAFPHPFTPIIDTHMRKRLPAWILEGLEKAEKEKQKKQQKEMEKKKAEDLQKAKEARRAEKGKGKFDSDSESDGEDAENEASNDSLRSNGNLNKRLEERPTFSISRSHGLRESEKHEHKPHEEMAFNVTLTLEERKQEALLAMRRLMTMVLLEATDTELERIAKDSLLHAKRKARPKLLASSNALSALTSFGDDDEEDEDDDSAQSDNGNDTGKKAKVDKSKDGAFSSLKHESKLSSTTAKNLNAPFSHNLVAILRPPTPESAESELERKNLAKVKDEEKLSDTIRHHSSSANSLSSSRHHSSLTSSSKHSSSSSSRRHHHSSSSKSSSKDRHRSDSSDFGIKSRASESSSKRRSEVSPPHQYRHSSSSSSKKRRH